MSDKIVDATLTIFQTGLEPEELRFTNLPLERVLDAIDLLNDDHVELIPERPRILPPWGSLVKAQRTEDFTLTELFGMYAPIPANRDITTASPLTCAECGAAVSLPHKHQEFHNKLLP